MAKNLKISLDIDANTSQAKKEIQALQNQLSKLGTGLDYTKGFGKDFTDGVRKAKTEIAELQAKIQMATNIDTGKLDFTKFNASLKASGKTLDEYAKTLVSLGPEGEQAFLQLSKAIAQSEIPIVRISDKLKSLQTTLSNTLRWQISSSVLHGFMGAIQSAYGYAQDLNESLNNIRIVTGQSTEQMAKFADEANKSAIALSATTTAYTDAALIFYQQGLNDQQVKERTDATIKMANITGESAEQVSSNMTAIWNNFDDGSRALENYGDVLVKLGAETAASTDEIAQGMSKFAAVADTVGLSYDYAAAAVATVVAQTRQSADIVGTAFKTLFARLESLQLGETLEDGVDLNKYSKALETVGVSVLDATGNLRTMNDILDDLGSKWKTLGDEQQVALAQTVGGVRQYTQLIALMENYDTFKENVGRAEEAEGYLENRQQIFEQSWEASNKRLKASWEALYHDIIEDDFFIKMQDSLAKLLQGIDKFIDSLGGVKGLLVAISPLVMNIFGDSIRKGINDMAYTLSMMNPANVRAMQNERTRVLSSAHSQAESYLGKGTAESLKYKAELDYIQDIAKYEKYLTEEQKAQLKIQQDQKLAAADRLKELKEEEKTLNEILKTSKAESLFNYEKTLGEGADRGIITEQLRSKLSKQGEQYRALNVANAFAGGVSGTSIGSIYGSWIGASESALGDNETFNKIKENFNQIKAETDKLNQKLETENLTDEERYQIKEDINQKWNEFDNVSTELIEAEKKEMQNAISKAVIDFDDPNTKKKQKFLKESYNNQVASLMGGYESLNLKGYNKSHYVLTNINDLKENAKARIADENTSKEDKRLLREFLKELAKIEKDHVHELGLTSDEFVQEFNQATEGLEESGQAEGRRDVNQARQGTARKEAEADLDVRRLALQTQQAQALTNGFMGLAQGVAGAASAYTQLNSLMNIWDEVAKGNVTTGQALAQTLATTSTLVFTFNSTIEGFKKVQEISSAIRIATLKAEKIEIEKLTEAELADAMAKVTLSDIQTVLIAKAKTLIATNAGLVTSFGVLAVALIALAAAYAYYKDQMEQIVALEEKNQEKLDKAKAWREENKAILEQCDAYDKLKNRYDSQVTSRESLNQSILETAKALEIENAEILANAGAYDLLQKEVDKKEAELKEQRNEMLEAQRVATREDLRLASLTNMSTSTQIGNAMYTQLQNWRPGYSQGYQDRLKGTHIGAGFGGSLNNAGEQAMLADLEALGLTGVTFEGSGFTFDQAAMSDAEYSQLLDFIADAMGDNFNKYGGAANDMLTELSKMVDDWGAYAEDYKGIIAEENQLLADSIIAETKLATSNEDTISQYLNAIQAGVRGSRRDGLFEELTDEEIAQLFANSLSSYFSEEVEIQFVKIQAAANSLGVDFLKLTEKISKFSTEDQELLIEGLTKAPEIAYTIINSSAENAVELLQSTLDKLDFTNITTGFTELQKALDSLSFGATYTAEQMQELANALLGPGGTIEELGEAYSDLFVEMSDGTYKIIGNIDKLSSSAYDSVINKLTTQSPQSLQKEIDELNKNTGGIGQLQTQIDTALAEKERIGNLSNLDDDSFSTRLYGEGNLRNSVTSYLSGQGWTDKDIEQFTTFLSENEEQQSLDEPMTAITAFIETYGQVQQDIIDGATVQQTALSNLQEQEEKLQAYNAGFTTAFEDDLITPYTTQEQLQDLVVKGLVSINKAQQTYIQTMIRSAEVLGINVDEFGEYLNYLEEENEHLEGDREAAAQVALAYERVQKGLEDLSSNISDYVDNLNEANKGTQQQAKSISSIEEDLQNLFNTDESISEDFILDHLEKIQAAAEGDIQAVRDLQQAYALQNIDNSVFDAINMSIDEIDNRLDEVAWDDIEIGMSINEDEFLSQLFDAMAAAVDAGTMAKEEMQEAWNSLGFELEPLEKEITTVTGYGSIEITKPGGGTFVVPGAAQTETTKVFAGWENIKGSSHYTGAASTSTISSATSSGKNKSSSGGGGKSSKKDEKEAKDEFERYYTITRQIKDQEDAVNRLDKAKERAWGKAKLEYLDKESDALEKQVKLQEQYLKEIEDYYRKDKGNLAAFGATFDENGVLTNYETLIQQELDKYNEAVEEYNSNQDEAAMESAEKRYQYFQETLKQYDETNQLYQSEMDKLTDLQNSLYDMKLEKIQTKVEMDVKVNAMELEQLEYQLDRIEKKAFSTAEAIANMVSSIENAQRDINSYEESTLAILKNHGIGSVEELGKLSKDEIAGLGFTQAEVEALIDNNSNLISGLQKINEYEEKILNGPLELFKEWNSEFDYYEDRLSHMTSLTKNYKDIAQLIYSNASGLDNSFMMGVMNNTYLNMVNEVGASHTELEANKKALEEARRQYEQALANGTNEQNLKILEDNLREMEKAVETSEDNMLSKTQEALKQVEEMLKETVANAKETFLDLVSASDWDMTQFDRLKTLDDQYLDDYEQIYEFSKLTRDVNKSMQTIDTIRGQERLKEILEEMADIQAQGKEVSQYEVDALRKKYELRLAEIALEDQQNAKSMVRMARDNEGNWSYVYTADRKKVDDAQQKYEDKLYEYQKLNSDFIKQQQQNFLKLEKEYADAMEKIATDATLTEDQKRERLMETQTYYENLGFIMTDQLGKAISRNKELYELDWTDYSRMTGYKISEEGKYQTALAYTYTGVLQPGIELATELFDQFTQATVHGYLPEIKQGLDDYKTNQEAVLKAAGMSMETYFKTVGSSMESMGERSAGVMHEMAAGAGQMGDQFSEVIEQVNELNNMGLDDIRSEIEDLIGNVSELVNEYNRLSSSLDTTVGDLNAATEAMKKFKEAAKGVSTDGNTITYHSDDDDDDDGKLGTLNNKDLTVDSAIKLLYSAFSDTSVLGRQNWNGVTKTTLVKWLNNQGPSDTDVYNQLVNYMKPSYLDRDKTDEQKELKKVLIELYGSGTTFKFDTGGYTGNWGNEGRLAFLHQKELVLNADDTKNMLDIVQFVRDIVSAVDTKAMAASVSNINTGFNYSNMNSNSLEQNVHIEASFPNATDHNEIELALTNLVNRASQYANRK